MALKSFRQYSEHDVVNLFGYHAGDSLAAGTVVKISEGVALDNKGPVETMGAIGTSVNNTVSMRYGTRAKVVPITTKTDVALGVTLMAVAEVDENGELLKFNPRKAAEMGVVLKGQAIPVLTKGVVHITLAGTGAAGSAVRLSDSVDGGLTTASDGTIVGKTLSAIVDGSAIVQLSF
jgi:hypothetical protein